MSLIALVTNITFYGRLSVIPTPPAQNHLGIWVIFIPIIGGVIVGLLARFGSRAIRGHGIPRSDGAGAHQSKPDSRATSPFSSPISAAIAIGTGGPFGAEGPIIATGGALGSLIGQIMSTTATERKTLLAAGAAAGMAATFGAPVSAVLLAIELLLFEFRPRSLIPVALAAATRRPHVRIAFEGRGPQCSPCPIWPRPPARPSHAGSTSSSARSSAIRLRSTSRGWVYKNRRPL